MLMERWGYIEKIFRMFPEFMQAMFTAEIIWPIFMDVVELRGVRYAHHADWISELLVF
jgi:hypothetical protein